MIALSDVADEDSAAHHVVDASDIFIDAGLACAESGAACSTKVSCWDGEEYNLSNILTPIIFVLFISWHDISSSCVSSLLVINSFFLSGTTCVMRAGGRGGGSTSGKCI